MDTQVYDKMIEEYETSLRIIVERINSLENTPGIANREQRLTVLYTEQKELEENIYHLKKYCNKY